MPFANKTRPWLQVEARRGANPSRIRSVAKLSVVAAENFYGDVVRQIGGDRVEVVSIMSNPDQDPHLFETTPTIVRQIAAAQIVVLMTHY